MSPFGSVVVVGGGGSLPPLLQTRETGKENMKTIIHKDHVSLDFDAADFPEKGPCLFGTKVMEKVKVRDRVSMRYTRWVRPKEAYQFVYREVEKGRSFESVAEELNRSVATIKEMHYWGKGDCEWWDRSYILESEYRDDQRTDA